MEVSEGNQHEERIDNERYELVNVDMEGGLVWGCGSPFRKTSEYLIEETPLHEQGESEAPHGNVAGV